MLDEIPLPAPAGRAGGSFRPASRMAIRARSGRSVINPSTPHAISRAMSAGWFTVHGTTRRPNSARFGEQRRAQIGIGRRPGFAARLGNRPGRRSRAPARQIPPQIRGGRGTGAGQPGQRDLRMMALEVAQPAPVEGLHDHPRRRIGRRGHRRHRLGKHRPRDGQPRPAGKRLQLDVETDLRIAADTSAKVGMPAPSCGTWSGKAAA